MINLGDGNDNLNITQNNSSGNLDIAISGEVSYSVLYDFGSGDDVGSFSSDGYGIKSDVENRHKVVLGEGDDSFTISSVAKSPFEIILENADMSDYATSQYKTGQGIDVTTGKKQDMIKEGIIDPVLVTKSALKNAISVVSTIISADCVISNKRIQNALTSIYGIGKTNAKKLVSKAGVPDNPKVKDLSEEKLNFNTFNGIKLKGQWISFRFCK